MRTWDDAGDASHRGFANPSGQSASFTQKVKAEPGEFRAAVYLLRRPPTSVEFQREAMAISVQKLTVSIGICRQYT